MPACCCGTMLWIVDEMEKPARFRGEKMMCQKGRKKMENVNFKFLGREVLQRLVESAG
jgi:extradiol dioxygenase family protein